MPRSATLNHHSFCRQLIVISVIWTIPQQHTLTGVQVRRGACLANVLKLLPARSLFFLSPCPIQYTHQNHLCSGTAPPPFSPSVHSRPAARPFSRSVARPSSRLPVVPFSRSAARPLSARPSPVRSPGRPSGRSPARLPVRPSVLPLPRSVAQPSSHPAVPPFGCPSALPSGRPPVRSPARLPILPFPR